MLNFISNNAPPARNHSAKILTLATPPHNRRIKSNEVTKSSALWQRIHMEGPIYISAQVRSLSCAGGGRHEDGLNSLTIPLNRQQEGLHVARPALNANGIVNPLVGHRAYRSSTHAQHPFPVSMC